MTPNAPWLVPLPTLRDVYVLCAGLILGIVIGPAVLGKLAPATYAQFSGAGPAYTQLQQHHVETGTLLAALQSTGVSDTALIEKRNQRAEEAATMQQVVGSLMDRTALLRLTAVGVGLFVIMLLEALLSPLPTNPTDADQTVAIPPRLARLITVRYGLLAIGVALVFARPSLLKELPWLFAAALLAVALLAGLVPLASKASPPTSGD